MHFGLFSGEVPNVDVRFGCGACDEAVVSWVPLEARDVGFVRGNDLLDGKSFQVKDVDCECGGVGELF